MKRNSDAKQAVGIVMIKRLMIFLMASVIGILPLVGCTDQMPTDSVSSSLTSSNSSADEPATFSHTIRLPYDSEDSLNPFTVKTLVNSTLIPVLYDGLFRLTPTYEAESVIAASITGSAKTYTVKLRNNITFSDGSKLSAKDVISSYESAKSSSRYQAQLKNVRSVTEKNDDIVFELETPDPLFVNLLDFAIVKKGTAKDPLPIGCGRYIAKVIGTEMKLVYNQKHHDKSVPSQTEIPLLSMPDNEAMLSGIKTGSLSAIYSDLSQGELSTAGALSAPADLSNLVYLGFHTQHDFVNDPSVRKAISFAIDRGTIFYNGFGGRGKQATLPIHPAIGAKQALSQESLLLYDLDAANKLLDDAGYKEKNLSGYRLKEKEEIALNLLVNADNNFKKVSATLIKEMLATIGIRVTVTEKPFAAYQADVKNGKYDLYVGEIKLLNNMNLSPLLSDPAMLGGAPSESLINAYNTYLDETGSYADFMTAFQNEMPFVPLLYRSGILIYNRNIKTDIQVSVTDVYYNLQEWA